MPILKTSTKDQRLKAFIKKYYGWLKDEDREELAQACHEEWARNPARRNVGLRYVVVDALRSHTNFSRTRRTSRLSLERLAEPHDACFSGPSQHESDPNQYRRDFGALIHSCGDLRRDEKIIMILKYIWGFNNEEIGEVAGYSESRASQKITQITEQIKGRVVSEEFARTAPQESRTLSQQIQTESRLQGETKEELGRVCEEKRPRLGFRAFPKIRVNTKSKIEFKKVFFQTGSYRKKETSLQRMGKN
jgi:DNA-directed RNA polymerase specialized sigma24 family protein